MNAAHARVIAQTVLDDCDLYAGSSGISVRETAAISRDRGRETLSFGASPLVQLATTRSGIAATAPVALPATLVCIAPFVAAVVG